MQAPFMGAVGIRSSKRPIRNLTEPGNGNLMSLSTTLRTSGCLDFSTVLAQAYFNLGIDARSGASSVIIPN